MDTFSFLSVLFSVILGLALTQILQGLRVLMLARSRVRVYWPALIWAALLVLLVSQAWWGMFVMRAFHEWNFAMYAVVVLQITLLYLAAGMVLPDVAPEGPVDMRKAYFVHARWFFGLMALTVAATMLRDVVTFGHISVSWNTYYLGFFFLLTVTSAITKSRWYHAILAPFSAATVVVYTALLSVRL
jgi:hypothetical protein